MILKGMERDKERDMKVTDCSHRVWCSIVWWLQEIARRRSFCIIMESSLPDAHLFSLTPSVGIDLVLFEFYNIIIFIFNIITNIITIIIIIITSRSGKTCLRHSPHSRSHCLQGLLRHATTSTHSSHQSIHLPPRRPSPRHRRRCSWSRPSRSHLRYSLPPPSYPHYLRTPLWSYGTCGSAWSVSLAGEYAGEAVISNHPQSLEDAHWISILPLRCSIEPHTEGLREEGERDQRCGE